MGQDARLTMHPAVSNGSYDVEKIRKDFPILSMQVYGKPLVYLDNAASAQKPKAVLDRLEQAYTSEYGNVHRGLHYLANAATEGYEGARERVRAFLNVYELISVGINENVFSERVSYAYWGDVLPWSFQAAEPLIQYVRQRPGEGTPSTYRDLERVARLWANRNGRRKR